MIVKEQLKQIMPTISASNLDRFIDPLNGAMDKWEINTPERQSAFLAQIAHESGCFKYTKELADGKAYEGREDLGNRYPGDGPRFKGRGLIQITGRTNYETYFRVIETVMTPELLEGEFHACNSAGWFWKTRGLNEIADKPNDWTREWRGNTYDKFQWITIKINGGLNHYVERLAYYVRAKKTLGIQ